MTDTTATEAETPDADRERKPPPAPTRLVLVRHGVTAHTGGLLSGRLPGIDLTDDGIGQARRTAERLSALAIAAIYASPIERTMQTAEIIAEPHALEVRICEGVVETEYGDWSGQKLSDLVKHDEWKVVQGAPSRAQFPNGETLRAMQSRVVDALDAVVAVHPHETVVVVSHNDPICAAIAHYTGVHLDLFNRLQVSPASVSVLDFHRFGVTMVKYNDTGSLEEPAPKASEPGNDAEAASDA
jgi:probable phosphoglycerate mutase